MATPGYSSFETLNANASEFNAAWFFFWMQMGKVRTTMPVKVLAVSTDGAVAATGTVTVQPLVNQTDGSGNPIAHAPVYGVPYFRLQGGANAMILDPQVGDIGLLACADRDVSSVVNSKAQANPGSSRRFSFSDGFYLGGFLAAQPTQYVQFVEGGGINLVDSFGNQIQMGSNGVTINGVLIDRSGNVKAPGEVTRGQGGSDQVTLGAHIHTTGGPAPLPGH